MGQIEVYEFLKTELATGNKDFFSVAEVERALKIRGFTNGVLHTVRGSLVRLEYYGYLETKMNGKKSDWKRLFRLKEQYLNPSTTGEYVGKK